MSEIIKPTRRGFITGIASLIVAPAIVRVESIMPVKAIPQLTLEVYIEKSIKPYYGLYIYDHMVDALKYGVMALKHNEIGLEIIPN